MDEFHEFVFGHTTVIKSTTVDVNLNEMDINDEYATENFSDEIVSIGESYTISIEYDNSCSIKSEISGTSQTYVKNWIEGNESTNDVNEEHVDSTNTSETSLKSLEAKIDKLEKEIKCIKYTLRIHENEQKDNSNNYNLQNKYPDITPKNRTERNLNQNDEFVSHTKSPMTSLYAKKSRSKSLPNCFPRMIDQSTSLLNQICIDQQEKALRDEELQSCNFYDGQKYFERNSMDNIRNKTKDISVDKGTNDMELDEYKLIANMPMNQYKFCTGRSAYRNLGNIGNKEYKNNSTQTDVLNIEMPISPQRSNTIILKNNHALSSTSESKLISKTHKPDYNFSKLCKNCNYPSHIPIATHYMKVGGQKCMTNGSLKSKQRIKSAIPIRSTSNRCSINSTNLDTNTMKTSSKEHITKDVGFQASRFIPMECERRAGFINMAELVNI